MRIFNSTPRDDNFRMPGEFERHQGCIMIWPVRPGSWIYGAKSAQKTFAQIATAISQSEQLYMLVSKQQQENAKQLLPSCAHIITMQSDDAWARDTGPTFVVSGNSATPYDSRIVRGINWEFNAWGGTFDGLYANWDNDNLIAKNFLNIINCDCYNASPFVLEGGSIHSDGEGTISW